MSETSQEIPPPHRRTLPHVQINEQGMRELELWIQQIFRRVSAVAAASGIRFNVDNEGGYLYVQTNECLDLDAFPDPLSVGAQWGTVLADDSGCGMLIGANLEELFLKARGGPVTILSDGGGGLGNAAVNININSGMILASLLASGDRFVVEDHLGSPLVTYTG